MKLALVTLCLLGSTAFASTLKLDDPAILGKYILTPENKKSDLQSAEVRFNNDNQLVVTADRNEVEYELSGPKDDGEVFQGTDEPNCDGDESACEYDLETKIWLNNVNGKPQLTIQITTDDGFDDSGKSTQTTTYVLTWAAEIPNAIPYYLNVENPAPVVTLLADCETAVKSTVGKGGFSNSTEVCGRADTVKYRDGFEEAFANYTTELLGSKTAKTVEAISGSDLEAIFAKENARISRFDDKNLTIPKAVLLNEAGKVQAFIANSSKRLYYAQWADFAHVFSVDEATKTIVNFRIDTGR